MAQITMVVNARFGIVPEVVRFINDYHIKMTPIEILPD